MSIQSLILNLLLPLSQMRTRGRGHEELTVSKEMYTVLTDMWV